MEIRPTDMPALRDEVADCVLRTGPNLYENAIRDGRQAVRPMAPPARAAGILVTAEVRRLKEAELFYVSAPMTQLASAAAGSLPEFSLMPEDLPARTGFILFERPFYIADYGSSGMSPIVAASWSHFSESLPESWRHGGCWITWYAARDGVLENAIRLGICDEVGATNIRISRARLLIDTESQVPFSPDPIPVLTQAGHEMTLAEVLKLETTGLIRSIAILKTAWLLMTQPMALVSDAVYDRAARRRIQREGKEPPRVRVITLRRPASAGSGDSDREYHHQWIVRGHWRQQWHPARQVHRPIWIEPHVKGPEGAPLIGGEKVHAWTR